MLASLWEWKEEVTISETGRDTVKPGNTRMDTVLWLQTLAGLGLGIQPQVKHRTFWWHILSPEPLAVEVRLNPAVTPWGCTPWRQSANTYDVYVFLVSSIWHYDERDKNGSP